MQSSAVLQTTLQKTTGRDPTTLTCSIFGVRVDVRIGDASLVENISSRLPTGCAQRSSDRVDRTYEFLNTAPGWSAQQDGVAGAPCWYLLADRSLVCQTDDPLALCERFQADLELFLAVRARTHVLVHATVVGWRGRAIVIPGRSSSEKTMLVEALIRLGAEYYSDQYAVIDPRGLVSPFRRSLFIGQRTVSRREYTAEDVGAIADQQPIPIATIVVSDQRGAATPVRQLSRGEAVLALLSNAPAARYQPGFLLKTFSGAVRGVLALSGPEDDVNEFAKRLVDSGERRDT